MRLQVRAAQREFGDGVAVVCGAWHVPALRQKTAVAADRALLKGLPKVKAVRASSAFGFSMIYVIFEDSADIYWARTRVLERLNFAASLLPAGWKQIKSGPAGGSVWEGEIPGAPWGHSFTHSYVYLPPNVSAGKRYPVLYVLHGFYGSPSSIVYGIALGDTADQLIQQGRVRQFIMVAPSGNSSTLYGGEWTGPRESFVVDTVVPWADANLPTVSSGRGRAIAGLSAGAYGAVDIALRHPGLFATAESWSGYFKPIADGTLHGPSRAELAAHDPSQLVAQKARLIRRLGTRFFLSCGATRDRVTASFARAHRRSAMPLRHESTVRGLAGLAVVATASTLFLSLLTVICMFISDLLLAALDPRIRLTGGVAK